jgi:predicted DNA-binding protein with PD1-like motif
VSNTVIASPAIVDTNTCHQLVGTDKPFILGIKKGENLFKSILHCADVIGLPAASISGLGALDDVTVAFYYLETKQYQTKLFEGTYELVSLNGNITFFEGKRFIHIHAALGTSDYNIVGGHIMDATVGPSAEITITPLSGKIHRKHDEEIDLKLMCPLS